MTYIKFNDKKATNFYNEYDLEQIQPLVDVAFQQLKEHTGAGSEYTDWLTWPTEYDKEEFANIQRVAKKIQDESDVLVVIGIGGSYLGAKMAYEYLKPSFYDTLSREKRKAPQVFFAGNSISASYLNDLIYAIGDRDFSVNVISKSGTTTEPSIAFRVFKELLVKKYGKEGAADRIYATTDANKGALHDEAQLEGYETFIIPNGIGGRFSVLSPVGLLPIAVCGADIQKLMDGAKAAQTEYFDGENVTSSVKENMALRYATLRNVLYNKGYTTELLINWEPSLQYVSEWWKQLMGESEGKSHKGIYPSSANFSTDLHSLGQYIQDGRRNLFETVLTIEKPVSDLALPVLGDNKDGLQYLEGKTIAEINKIAAEGVSLAHVDGGVPNLSLVLPEQNEYSLGNIIYFFEIAVAISGYLLAINPFDQPGVEQYKAAMFALLGKPGYEEETKKLKARL